MWEGFIWCESWCTGIQNDFNIWNIRISQSRLVDLKCDTCTQPIFGSKTTCMFCSPFISSIIENAVGRLKFYFWWSTKSLKCIDGYILCKKYKYLMHAYRWINCNFFTYLNLRWHLFACFFFQHWHRRLVSAEHDII